MFRLYSGKTPRPFFIILMILAPVISAADDFRVAVLQFGTVSWEMDVIKHHGLDKKHNFNLEIVSLGSANAVNVRLQSKDVDAVVGDWIWVSRQRDMGNNYTSFPYSLAAGEVIVNPELNISTLEDLNNKKIGVAGGPTNKNWLIYKAYTHKKFGINYQELLEISFAAPPLLNKLFLKGDFSAVINFWHYAAKLKHLGMVKLISIKEMLTELEVNESTPLLAWVFPENKNIELINSFLSASFEAKKILKTSDNEWNRIKNLLHVKNEGELILLRDYYRESIPDSFGESEIVSAKKLYEILKEYGGSDFGRSSKELNQGTFYTEYTIL